MTKSTWLVALSVALPSVWAITLPQNYTACAADAGIPSLANISASFPTLFVTAAILPGDTVATNLWNSIQSNPQYAAALAIPVKTVVNSVPNFSGYDVNTDPDCWWTANGCLTPKQSYLAPDYWQCNQPKTWGIGVDDGPLENCELYDIFELNNITATVFYIGTNVVQNVASATRAFEAGHMICVHTWSHQYTTSLTSEQVFAELYYTMLAIKRVTGYTPRCFRPPYGDVDDRVRAIAYALSLDVWIWGQDTNDWEYPQVTAQQVQANYDQIIGNASSAVGMMVLQHELTLAMTQFFVSNFPAITQTFTGGLMSAHVCQNQTHPWSEPDAPILPTYQHYQQLSARPFSPTKLIAQPNISAQIVLLPPTASRTGPDEIDLLASASAAAAAASSSAAAAAAAAGSASSTTAGAHHTAGATAGPSSGSSLSTGAYVGIGVGAAAVAALASLGFCFLRNRNRRRGQYPDQIENRGSADGAGLMPYRDSGLNHSTATLEPPKIDYVSGSGSSTPTFGPPMASS